MNIPKILILTLLSVMIFFLISCQSSEVENTTATPVNFKVAFIGDQGLSNNSRAVLQLIKGENADMVLHQGDFDYEDNPDKWDQQINDILGQDFPYFASIGNHDAGAWDAYQRKLQARLDRIDDARCAGDLGVASSCAYNGLFFILSGIGTKGYWYNPDKIYSFIPRLSRYHPILAMPSQFSLVNYIKNQLARDNSIWKICSWHKNQRLMQVGYKPDEVSWGPYEECRKGGAIIATGHEHSYSRTHLMGNFKNKIIASASNTLQIEKGKTFAFVSGLGGHSIRFQNDELAANDWWAAVYTSNQNANYGALFCIFNENGIKNKAHCYFKDIDGNIPDEFDVVSNVR